MVSNLFNRFLSEEQSVHVDGRIGTPVAGQPSIQHENLDRTVNTLVPALTFKIGAEDQVFTFSDFINRLEVLGVDTSSMHKWMAEQTFNYSLPISYDKLINFSSYFWIGKQQQTAAVWNPELDPEFYVIARAGGDENDWQAFNFWVHRDDVAALGYSLSDAIQATRPIIEYNADLQLNARIAAGSPTDTGGVVYTQTKTRFNQIPQFDLFRQDGTHAGATSGIFFYQEDPDFTVDTVLRKRVKLTPEYDYIFAIGLRDSDDALLYFKEAGELHGLWREGPAAPVVTSLALNGQFGPAAAKLQVQTTPVADSQQWVLTASESGKFQVRGSRSGAVGELVPGIPLSVGGLVLDVTPAQYAVADTFTFSVQSPIAPRYVMSGEDGKIVNYVGDPSSDLDGVGTWQYPTRMSQNVMRETRKEIKYGDIVSHMRSVIRAQDGFQGVSYGVNNSRKIAFNPGLGGTIREFSGNFQLLASMLMQRDISPLSMIDFAEMQYNLATASVDQFIATDLAEYLSANEAITIGGITTQSQQIRNLLASFEAARAANANLKAVFSDTTAPIANWPATAPMLGLLPAVNPAIVLNSALQIYTVVHHDGHISPVTYNDTQLNSVIARTNVKRSDGIICPGVVAATAPLSPYARQLWVDTTDTNMYVFDVVSDSDIPPQGGEEGQFWFKRVTREVYVRSASSWQLATNTTVADLWVPIDIAAIRNSLLLAVEQKLYLGVSVNQQQHIDLSRVPDSEEEFARFSNKYGYDRFATDYDPLDAFTWNYSKATIPTLERKYARWYTIYENYFDKPGLCLPTRRPDLEPWKLLNMATKPVNWDALYKYSNPEGTNPMLRLWNDIMWDYIKEQRPGLKLCVDIATDRLLPPYVSPSSQTLRPDEALLNVIPPGISDPYKFGEGSPVEMVWKQSQEYIYGKLRSYFKMAPMEFLDNTWGETYLSTGTAVRVERNTLAPLPASKFLLHGEKLHKINTYTAEQIAQIVDLTATGGPAVLTVTVEYCGNDKTFFSVSLLAGADTEQLIIEQGRTRQAPLTAGSTQISNLTIRGIGNSFSVGEAFTVAIDAQGELTYSHRPATLKVLNGTGQWFTNLLRFNVIDFTNSDVVSAFRGWDSKLAYRVGALIRPDSLVIETNQGKLPSTAFTVHLKKSLGVASRRISAIRVQLVEMGKTATTSDKIKVPASDYADDWVFRIEGYNPHDPLFETYELQTLLDVNTPQEREAPFTTFTALGKGKSPAIWKRYTNNTGVKKVAMPVTLVGLQNVINFIYGYVDRLEDNGWNKATSDTTSVDTEGRNIDWQLEIEKLIDAVFTGMSTGQGIVLNPFMNKMIFSTPVGLLGHYTESNFVDVNSAQAVFDVTGSVIPLSELNVIRTDDETVTISSTPMFSAHLFLDEYEHLVVMNRSFSDSAVSPAPIIFDQFLGKSINSAYLSFVRQDELTKKPSFNGFFLTSDGLVRNPMSSIDSMGLAYDSTRSFGEKDASKHALSLLGYSPKDYFSSVSTNEATQFNFWRGLIQAKGTNMTVDAFVNYKQFIDASVDEFWAYKIAEFGDAREKTQPEIKINTGDVTQKFTRLQFYSQDDAAYSPLALFTQVEKSDDTRWYSIDDLGKGLKFEAQRISEKVSVPEGTSPASPFYYKLKNIYHNGDSKGPTIDMGPNIAGPFQTLFVSADTVKISAPGEYIVSGYTWINPSKLSPIKLFDYQQQDLVTHIGLWHPAIGIHANEALEIVDIQGTTDPAQYNYSTKVSNNANLRRLKPWGEREVGRVWWDTHNLGYVPYYDATVFANRDARDERWGALAEWASVDLYQWTESDVHPSEYDAIAAAQEGNSSIDPSVRASGKVALKKYYSRNRVVRARTIAWSRAGVGDANAHPAFGPAEFTNVYVSSDVLIADAGRLSQLNIVAGRRFGGWKSGKPQGEVVIGTDMVYDLGSSAQPGVVELVLVGSEIGAAEIALSTDTNSVGRRIGQIKLTKKELSENADGVVSGVALTMSDSTGHSQDVILADWYSFDVTADASRSFEFSDFGLRVVITRAADELLTAQQIATALTSPLNDIFVREGVRFTTVVPLPDTLFVNDTASSMYTQTEYEWRTWEVPTQAQLDADLESPRNTWLPYLGDLGEPLQVTAEVVARMKEPQLTLSSGIPISRFSTTWTDWVELGDMSVEVTSDGATNYTYMIGGDVDRSRLSVYVNGVQLNPSSYTVSAGRVSATSTFPEGATIRLLYRSYTPTTEELSFNPDESDDVKRQVQYKLDYQYSVQDTRSAAGNIVGKKYFFWVQDKTVPQRNRNISMVQAKSLLINGPSTFALFSRLAADPESSSGAAYDSCAIAGLDLFVTKNNAFKLRFVRNFTLRDDPEEMNLKNTHTEWTLIRRGQTSKIPASLWDKLTDAVAGRDVGGNDVPSLTRVAYDQQNGTQTRFGFKPGQIFADTSLVRTSISHTILNTSLTINLGMIPGTETSKIVPDTITALDLDDSHNWFSSPEKARETMNLIWATARPTQINEIFFSVLDDALASNYEFSDIFKTSYITVSSSTSVSNIKQESSDVIVN